MKVNSRWNLVVTVLKFFAKLKKKKVYLIVTFFVVLAYSNGYIQFSSVVQSCSTLCDPINHSTPGLPVHHQLPELT